MLVGCFFLFIHNSSAIHGFIQIAEEKTTRIFKWGKVRTRTICQQIEQEQNHYLLLPLGALHLGKYSMYPFLYTIINEIIL